MNELVKPTLKVDLDIKLPEIKPVEHNLDIIEDYAKKLNEYYNQLVFTNDQYKDATSERTKVNKLKKAIEDNRKEIVKKYKEPIDDFESTSKRIEKLLGQASDTIGLSIEKFDLEQAEIKRAEINKWIEEIRQAYIDDFNDYASPIKTLEIEFDNRWFNKTYKDADIKSNIKDQFDAKIDDLDAIKRDAETISNYFNAIDIEHLLNKEVYIERYKFTRDVNAVMSSIKTDYDAKKQTVTGIVDTGIKEVITEEDLVQDPFAGLSVNTKIEDKTYRFTFTASEAKLNALVKYAIELGISIKLKEEL